MGISQVGGNIAQETTGATSLAVTYSPTAGNCAVLFFITGGTSSGLTVQDNLSNTLTAGPTATLPSQGTGSGIPTLASFYQFPVPAGVTSYTANWTTARQASLVVEEYTNVVAVNASLSGNSAAGTGTTVSITVTTLLNNAWIVGGLADDNSQTPTGTVGNQRQQTTTPTGRIVLVDNTVVLVGSVTCTATVGSSSPWGAVALQLQAGGGGILELALLGCGL